MGGGAGGPARHDTDEAEGFICDTILIFDADGRCCHGGPHGHGYGNAQCSTKAVFRRQGVGHCSNVSPLQVCFLAQRLPGGERGIATQRGPAPREPRGRRCRGRILACFSTSPHEPHGIRQT